MEDMCSGCATNSCRECSCSLKNLIDAYYYKNECPCVNCLIKCICVTICGERMNYGLKLKEIRYREEELRI